MPMQMPQTEAERALVDATRNALEVLIVGVSLDHDDLEIDLDNIEDAMDAAAALRVAADHVGKWAAENALAARNALLSRPVHLGDLRDALVIDYQT